MIDSKKLIENYLNNSDWRVKENSSVIKNFGGLNKYISKEVSKDYWLNTIYGETIKQAYLSGDLHIHDLGDLTLYCCGFSIKNILLLGVKGVSNIPRSSPASHFDSALNQIANLATVYQNEIAGAVAFNSIDTLLSPFIRKDNLTKKQVKQSLQNFIYSINSNSRGGAEPAFTNLTLDLTPMEDLKNDFVIIDGELQDSTYSEYQNEIDVFNECFSEIIYKGDADGKGFAYPIITYNIGKSFDWEDPKYDHIFELAGKYGYPYFANFVNSELSESEVRSMCCRLRLSLSELKKRNGGLFGSGDNTGSIGVVTINMPRIGILCDNKKDFFNVLYHNLCLAKDSLEIKRKFVEDVIIKEHDLLPAFRTYVGTTKNHFSTIGIVGLNEMCQNFLGEGLGIDTEIGKAFALEVGEFIRNTLKEFQIETGNLYNYEATPAEGTCYRLALSDCKTFGFENICVQGTCEAPYYTNSCHIPVSKITSIDDTYSMQEELQLQFTGGTVIHNYLEGGVSKYVAKSLIKRLLTTYKVPYTSLSPITRYCKNHGFISEITTTCPKCGSVLELYQRVTGYTRPVSNFNIGKKQEFIDRKQYPVGEDL